MDHTNAIPNGPLCEVGRRLGQLAGWRGPGLADGPRMSRQQASLCDGAANDGAKWHKQVPRIKHNY